MVELWLIVYQEFKSFFIKLLSLFLLSSLFFYIACAPCSVRCFIGYRDYVNKEAVIVFILFIFVTKMHFVFTQLK